MARELRCQAYLGDTKRVYERAGVSLAQPQHLAPGLPEWFQSAIGAPAAGGMRHENRQEVRAMLRLLPQRHREVITRRYGLNDTHAQSHDEIGEWLAVGEERSRQIEREALHRLRSMSTRLVGRAA